MKSTVLKVTLTLASIILIGVLLAITVSHKVDRSSRLSRATADAQSIGMAIQAFAESNDGKIPMDLTELVPNYISVDATLFKHMRLTTPGAILKSLPKDSIIAFLAVPDKNCGLVIISRDGNANFLSLR